MEVIDSEDFKELLKGEKELFVVSFFTNSCPNCTTITNVFNEILIDTSFKVFKINAETEYELVKDFELLGVPTTLFYRHGFLVAKKLGVKSKSSLIKTIKKFQAFTEGEAEEYSKKSLLSKMISGWLKK